MKNGTEIVGCILSLFSYIFSSCINIDEQEILDVMINRNLVINHSIKGLKVFLNEEFHFSGSLGFFGINIESNENPVNILKSICIWKRCVLRP